MIVQPMLAVTYCTMELMESLWSQRDYYNAKRYQYYVRPHRAIEPAFSIIYYLGLVIDKVISSVHWSLATKLNSNLWKLLNPSNRNFLLYLDSWPTRELHFLQFSMKIVYDILTYVALMFLDIFRWHRHWIIFLSVVLYPSF